MIKYLTNIDSSLRYELYTIVVMILGVLSWLVSYEVFQPINLLIAIFMLIKFKDFKYIVPSLFILIFGYSDIYTLSSFPYSICIIGITFILILIVYTIKYGVKIKYNNHLLVIGLIAVLSILPLAWHNIIKKNDSILYILYFGWLLYLFIYVIFKKNFKNDSYKSLFISLEYLGLFLAFQCIYKTAAYAICNPSEPFLNIYYFLGWGICNEAGILMIFTAPFIFMRFKNTTTKGFIATFIKVGILSVGMVLTSSRATILISFIELIILMVYSIIKSNKRKLLLITSISVAVVIYLCFLMAGTELFSYVINEIYIKGDMLDDNGRFELWQQATLSISKSLITIIFGKGIVGEYYSWNNNYVVYHSTIFQMLQMMGVVGVILLIIHFIIKYKKIGSFDKDLRPFILIGFIITDLYGMMDNTYSMYYFMIPLMIIIASIENRVEIQE